ncbi:hypothetical protein AB0L53_34230 [Nonomuraea sp. NPDC052129]|uniref:hypothetical protein n=1 Tax=Nonomuraea sp. NPDC052129 TaxID=3154651 RepID=UPI00342FD179
MINWEAAGHLSQQRLARQQRFADAVGSVASHDDEGEDDSHDLPRDALAGPRPTLGTAPPVATPRPPVGRVRAYFAAQDIHPSGPTPLPGQAYAAPPVATFQHGAVGHTAPAAVNGRAAPIGAVTGPIR